MGERHHSTAELRQPTQPGDGSGVGAIGRLAKLHQRPRRRGDVAGEAGGRADEVACRDRRAAEVGVGSRQCQVACSRLRQRAAARHDPPVGARSVDGHRRIVDDSPLDRRGRSLELASEDRRAAGVGVGTGKGDLTCDARQRTGSGDVPRHGARRGVIERHVRPSRDSDVTADVARRAEQRPVEHLGVAGVEVGSGDRQHTGPSLDELSITGESPGIGAVGPLIEGHRRAEIGDDIPLEVVDRASQTTRRNRRAAGVAIDTREDNVPGAGLDQGTRTTDGTGKRPSRSVIQRQRGT